MIRAALARKLKLRNLGRLRVETAKGTMWVMQSMCSISIQGRARVVPVLVAPGLGKVLIGVTTLESMGWNLDMVRRRLVRSRLLLYALAPVA